MTDFLTAGNLPVDTPIRILHVDDDPARIRLSASLLMEHISNAEIYTETDPMEACTRLNDGLVVDCIVSDFDMGPMNGLDFLDAVREQFPDLPFILFTGKGIEEIASEAISAGATDYLQKSGGTQCYAVLANRIENTVRQHRTEQATVSYQERIRSVYERITDAFLALDDEWKLTFVNERGKRLLDRSEEELHGAVFWDVFPGTIDSRFEAEYRRAMERREPTTFEASLDSLETSLNVRAYPSTNGLSVFFRDATAENRLREEHRREKALLEQVFETSPLCLAIMDENGVIRRANDRMVELLEITEEEITNRTSDSSQWTITDENGDDLPDDKRPLTAVFENEATVSRERIGYESPSGEWSLHTVSAAPIHAEPGKMDRVVVAIEDVSEL
ncbi:PAS domain-containing response regulator [Haladaptatus caseinilyticus]|uniref:PAS domain-containing response regulator n=1 Tax=Haladaptatus caseinilyticus TaxID=2993314 RepID=UPI00224AA1F2|nr:PAS domain-containing protein [Haladaptatus caseinilyticus]